MKRVVTEGEIVRYIMSMERDFSQELAADFGFDDVSASGSGPRSATGGQQQEAPVVADTAGFSCGPSGNRDYFEALPAREDVHPRSKSAALRYLRQAAPYVRRLQSVVDRCVCFGVIDVPEYRFPRVPSRYCSVDCRT